MEESEAYQALSIFCQKYEPASITTVTDYFTSREIKALVDDHTGTDISLLELHKLMIQLKFTYLMSDDEFRWLSRKCDLSAQN